MKKQQIYRILFTGVGRRVELMQAFRQAANDLNLAVKLYGADMDETAPALVFCDYQRNVCSMRDKEYITQLLNICQADQIDLLIPTIDTDLQVLSQNEERFAAIGTKVLVSKPDKISVCRDKNQTGAFLESCGLKEPETVNDYRSYLGMYPCFIKPKDGSSSINAFKVKDESELKVYAEKIKDYIVQPFIEGQEYTVDIFCDYEGNPIYITPRIRLSVRSGEVLKTKIAMDERIIRECEQLISKFKPCGPLTVQLIRQNVTGEDYYIEINPRFGGGAPLSMKAGARSAEAVLKILSGQTAGYMDEIDDGAVYSRFDQSVRIKAGQIRQPLRGIVFDLDDTLYSEKQYIRSGFQAVSEFLENKSYANRLWKYFAEGKPAIDELLKYIGQEEKKEQCLSIYREHVPKIELYDGAVELIEKLKDSGVKVGIITDGRVSGQKKKIEALGLDRIVDDIIITDELGGVQFRKPCDISFRIMRCRWGIPFEQMMYVGDNVNKDFQAPNQLGMRCLLIQNRDGLYVDDQLSRDVGRRVVSIKDVIQEVML